MKRETLSLYFIMGSNNTSEDPLIVLEQAIMGGVTCFQYREKGSGALTGIEKEKLGRELMSVCRKYQVPFIVNDDVDLAIKLKADGVHTGQDDQPLEEVKKMIPSSMITGVSAKTLDEAREAEKQGADYIGVGPMFATKTKEDAEAPVGPSTIQQLRRQKITLPIVGIGGIEVGNAQQVIDAGADGISLISAISQAKDPEQAARLLRESISF
ncbi:thiamine phosphate synthase [Alteribacillus iranensis]|uniref:Thiamine-phosphate synthase n=1 Tax=Alteribacillus iranensis TaxID=930128 RepID=A0A1I2DGE0_9BACI|nr:thiamine phosphate synthase [Alteribacillus iranensis]SFE79431.1 thiamine-phosphate diphosphorylase [Alteribacillus iranensis]